MQNRVKVKVGRTLRAAEILVVWQDVVEFWMHDRDGKRISFSNIMDSWGRNGTELVLSPLPERLQGSGYDVAATDGNKVCLFPLDWMFGIREEEVDDSDPRYVKMLCWRRDVEKGVGDDPIAAMIRFFTGGYDEHD